jgi:protein ImuB
MLAQLVDRVAAMLLAHGRGAIRLACRLDCAGGEPLIIQVGLYHPAADPRHLLELISMQLERQALAGSVGRVGVQVTLTAPLAQQQGELFADAIRDAPRQLAALVDRLSSRLGRQLVLRPELRADALPERACRYLPLAGRSPKNRRRRSTPVGGPRFAMGDRPLRLFSPPVEIETLSVVPGPDKKGGPPVRFTWRRRTHQIVMQRGPERIETGWWRGRTTRRDYYRVETALGERYWLFRRLDDGRWFLHGVFE